MPPPSARTILLALSALLGVLSIGDRGLHRLTGSEHRASPPGADEGAAAVGECPLDRLAAEPVATIGILGVRPFDRPFARAEAAPTSVARPDGRREPSASRAPPAPA